MVDMAKEIVKVNGYSYVINVFKGKAEKIDLSVPKVDIIISKWTGNFKHRCYIKRWSKIEEFKNDGQGKVSCLEDEKANVVNMIVLSNSR
nr:probable protein arginine N-methyltransferase 1 [Tanacetum cinerariifolium]